VPKVGRKNIGGHVTSTSILQLDVTWWLRVRKYGFPTQARIWRLHAIQHRTVGQPTPRKIALNPGSLLQTADAKVLEAGSQI
jgi:hypothetical protein